MTELLGLLSNMTFLADLDGVTGKGIRQLNCVLCMTQMLPEYVKQWPLGGTERSVDGMLPCTEF